MENNNCSYSCSGSESLRLIFSCSGSSDVGGLSDAAARKLNGGKEGKMYCLAGIGGKVSGIIETTKSAEKILVIDGCPVNCGKKTLEREGFAGFKSLQLSDIGLKKGHSEINEANIAIVVEKSKELLNYCAEEAVTK